MDGECNWSERQVLVGTRWGGYGYHSHTILCIPLLISKEKEEAVNHKQAVYTGRIYKLKSDFQQLAFKFHNRIILCGFLGICHE